MQNWLNIARLSKVWSKSGLATFVDPSPGPSPQVQVQQTLDLDLDLDLYWTWTPGYLSTAV